MTKGIGDRFAARLVFLTVGLVVTFLFLASLLPELEKAGDALNQTKQCDILAGCLFNATNSSASPCRLEFNQSLACDRGTGEIPLSSLFSFSIMGLLVMAVVIVAILSSIAVVRRGNK